MATTTGTSSSTSAADVFAAIGGRTSSSKTSTASATEDRFLTLLTTQLKNQDPLNPTDNAQLTSQLAQINTVQGIESLNSTLTQLLSAYNDSQSMQAASLIGKTVLVPGNDLMATTNSGWVAGAALDSDADKVMVDIVDSKGKVIQSENLGAKSAGSFVFSWDGKDASGNAVSSTGSYTFKVTATKGGQSVGATTLQAGTVNALVRSSNGFQLDLGDAGTYKFSDVQQIL